MRRVLAEHAGTDEGERARRAKRLADVTRKKENLLAAIRTPTTKAELEALEADEAKLMATPRSAEVIRLLPKAAERFRRLARDLAVTLAKEPERARAELEDLTGGKIVLRPDETGLMAELLLAAMANLLNRKGNIRIGSGGRI